MARSPLVPLDALPAGLAEAVARGTQSRLLSSTTPVQVWAQRPALAHAWLGLLERFQQDSLLTERLRELVRLKIASITTCQACQLARKSDDVSEADIACLANDNAHFSASEQAALAFAELFAGDYMAIGDEHFRRLAEWFTPAQVVELNMYCALMLAGGRMTYVQQAY
ncbi:carboxymuconolactone decarboxylase family protein [Pseudomonas typographi]|uniref:carboxymuconolactone decarboxylase family protein n=1 Tax=Pseudomonas typographi TaxID=2715964 RepID=UPI0016856621